jgi:ferredoxin
MKKLALVIAIAMIAACAGILGLRKAKQGMFPHRAHVIAGVSCTRCHANVADGKPTLHLPDDANCTSCHTKPHDQRSCLGCHAAPAPGGVTNLVETRQYLKFEHAKHAAPTNNNCMRCHDGVATNAEKLRPPMATCFKCHDKEAERDGRRCDACHKDLPDSRTLPETHLAHDGDWIREHGARAASSGELCESCHKQSMCAGCHGTTAPALPAARRFADPLTPSIHRAGFAARHALEARSDPGACATCHQPDRCASCHVERGVGVGVGGRNPHPAGWVGLASSDNRHGREARRDPAACAACHGGAGESLCVSCHAVGRVGGNPHPAGFSSRQPLTAMPCRMCHPNGALR